METKNCPYCGEEILAEAKKCKHCGEWIEGKLQPQHPKIEKPKGSNKILIISALTVLLLIGGGCYFLFANSDKQESNMPADIYTQLGINKNSLMYKENQNDIEKYIDITTDLSAQIEAIVAEGFKPENAYKHSNLKTEKEYYQDFVKAISKLEKQYEEGKDMQHRKAIYELNKIEYLKLHYGSFFNIKMRGFEHLSGEELRDIYNAMYDSLNTESIKLNNLLKIQN